MHTSKYGRNKKSVSLVIILDEEASAYLTQVVDGDINQYIIQLLEEARQRQQRGRIAQRPDDENFINRITSNTPDTSGYPEITDHFTSG